MADQLDVAITPLSTSQVAGGLVAAWNQLFSSPPPKKGSILVLLAQSALETGRWRALKNYNFGNVKSVEGDGRDYTYFTCNELFRVDVARRYADSAKPRSDNSDLPDVVITGTTTSGLAITWFYPDNPGCRFRAFKSLLAGATDYLALLRKQFLPSWQAVLMGDPVVFVRALKAQGYFTADEAMYERSVVSLFKEFSRLDFSLDPAALSDEEKRDILSVVALNLRELSESLDPGPSSGPDVA